MAQDGLFVSPLGDAIFVLAERKHSLIFNNARHAVEQSKKIRDLRIWKIS